MLQTTSLTYKQFGRPEQVIQLEQKQLPFLKYNDVLIEMLLVPINPSDLIPISGAYAQRVSPPLVAGYEGVGTISQVGHEKNEHLIGEIVLPLRSEGTWQTHLITHLDHVVIVPKTISTLTASQLYINPLTAFVLCKEILHLNKKDTLIINAANSSIGKIFCQFAAIYHFDIIAVVRSEKALDELKPYNIPTLIYENETQFLQEAIHLLNGRHPTVAIDCIGGVAGTALGKLLLKKSTFITLGLLSGQQVDWRLLHEELDLDVQLFHLRHWNKHVSLKKWHSVFQSLIELVQSKQLILNHTGKVFHYTDYQTALKHAHAEKVFIQFKKEIADL